jgi:hypothetical protein
LNPQCQQDFLTFIHSHNKPNIIKYTNLFNKANQTKPQHKIASMSAQDIPTGEVQDNEYQSRTGQNEIPVQTDDKPVEDPIDPETADSDATLGKPFRILSLTSSPTPC